MKTPKYITFDCYGTLTNFELTAAVTKILGDSVTGQTLHDFLIVFRDVRYFECFLPYKKYSDLLRITFKKSMDICNLKYKNDYGEQLVAAVPTWGGFKDTKPVMDKLAEHFNLVIVSNAEDDMIAQNIKNMDIKLFDVITAEQAHAYKPTPEAFYYAQRRLGCLKEDILHVAQGFNYDIMPAHGLGWDRVWINRNGRPGNQEDYGPYLEYSDLTPLLKLLGIE